MLIFFHNRYRNLITFLCVNRNLDIINEIYNVFAVAGCNFRKALILGIFPACRNVNLDNAFRACVDCIIVHLYNLVAFLAVSCLCSSLHQLDCPFLRNDFSKFEECGLQNRVDTSAKSDFLTNLDTIDGIELDIILCNISLDLSR